MQRKDVELDCEEGVAVTKDKPEMERFGPGVVATTAVELSPAARMPRRQRCQGHQPLQVVGQ